MNPIIKPWPFRGWRIDLIGQIFLPSSKGHKFILVATDYFTKWVEAIPLKTVTSKSMVDFIMEHIVYCFGISQTITTDQGTMFTSEEFRDFAASMGIKLLNSFLIMLKLMARQRHPIKFWLSWLRKKNWRSTKEVVPDT